MEQLRQELAPSGPLEKVLVAQVLSYLVRLRKAAQAEPEGTIKDAAWLRYHSMAERGFWKYYNELMKGRRQKARSAPRAESPATAPAPVAVAPAPVAVAPAPGPAPVAPPRTAVAPVPLPEPRRRADPSATTEADRLRRRAECLALIAAQQPTGGAAFLPITVGSGAPAAPKAEPVAAGS